MKDVVESDNEGDEEGKIGAKVRTELVGAREMAIGAVAEEIAVVEEIAMEGVIAEAVISIDAMVAEVAEESGAI